MLFEPKTQQKAVSVIKDLVKADPSYKNTPSFGFVLLLNEQGFFGRLKNKFQSDNFSAWTKENPEAFQQLKDRTYVFGRAHNPDQDMPVTEEIYRKIQNLS